MGKLLCMGLILRFCAIPDASTIPTTAPAGMGVSPMIHSRMDERHNLIALDDVGPQSHLQRRRFAAILLSE